MRVLRHVRRNGLRLPRVQERQRRKAIVPHHEMRQHLAALSPVDRRLVADSQRAEHGCTVTRIHEHKPANICPRRTGAEGVCRRLKWVNQFV